MSPSYFKEALERFTTATSEKYPKRHSGNCAEESEAFLLPFETNHLNKTGKSTTILKRGKLTPSLRLLSSARKHLFNLDQVC
ncbi:MAG: hypothetical protein CBC46_10155 [Verrucomicrobiaceae bacterium TMED86]|nr:MAG: hypothetical protein CBC46_10155 [Verrucomicrobiaceae bacterium TMED86]